MNRRLSVQKELSVANTWLSECAQILPGAPYTLYSHDFLSFWSPTLCTNSSPRSSVWVTLAPGWHRFPPQSCFGPLTPGFPLGVKNLWVTWRVGTEPAYSFIHFPFLKNCLSNSFVFASRTPPPFLRHPNSEPQLYRFLSTPIEPLTASSILSSLKCLWYPSLLLWSHLHPFLAQG